MTRVVSQEENKTNRTFVHSPESQDYVSRIVAWVALKERNEQLGLDKLPFQTWVSYMNNICIS